MKRLFVEYADTPPAQAKGMMGRSALNDNRGMLFKFTYAHRLRFWMKNTYLPLDIGFLSDKGEILQIASMMPLTTRAVTSNHICKYALEVNEGWFKDNKFKEGDVIYSEIFNPTIKTAQGFWQNLKNKVFPKQEDDPEAPQEEISIDDEVQPEGEAPDQFNDPLQMHTMPYGEDEVNPMDLKLDDIVKIFKLDVSIWECTGFGVKGVGFGV
jgi:uncharacterized membrane protein (UPF0127 family)